ncbi:MAG: erythromycin esterase family protein [Halorhabdus sp.]
MLRDGSPAERLAAYVTPMAERPEDATVPEPLAGALTEADLIGLGEATHGTAQFTRLRRVVLEYMVTELGCRLFALEANYPEALALDAYVADGEGDPEDALEQLNTWVWQTEEMADLLRWIREFNINHPDNDRVRIRGFDAQYVEEAAQAIRNFLADTDPEFLERVTDDLETLADERIRGDRYNVANEHIETAEETVATLKDRFKNRITEYAARSSKAAVDQIQWHLRTLEGAVAFASESYETDAPHGAVNRRDEYMAQSVISFVTEADGPVAIWGHNGHLLPGTTFPEDEWFTPMGYHLAERYGDCYRVVATDFNRGSFTATPDPLEVDDPQPTTFTVDPFDKDPPYRNETWAPERTVNGVLADHEAEACYLDVTGAAADDDLADWLDQHHPVRDIGNAFWDESTHLTGYRLPKEMVGLLFATKSTPTTVLDRGNGNEGCID